MNKLIGLTGPSAFTSNCINMIENYCNSNFVMLYQENFENVKYWLDQCGGVVISGGIDIHPMIYDRHLTSCHNLKSFDYKRDLRELQIINYCMDNLIPLFGICRGHQLIGLAKNFGRSFISDLLGNEVAHAPSRQGISLNAGEFAHKIRILCPQKFDVKNSVENEILDNVMIRIDRGTEAYVNSHHHQGIAFVPKFDYIQQSNTLIIAVAEYAYAKEGAYELIEMMAGIDKPWVSCQWHPEEDFFYSTPSRKAIDMFLTLIEKRK